MLNQIRVNDFLTTPRCEDGQIPAQHQYFLEVYYRSMVYIRQWEKCSDFPFFYSQHWPRMEAILLSIQQQWLKIISALELIKHYFTNHLAVQIKKLKFGQVKLPEIKPRSHFSLLLIF